LAPSARRPPDRPRQLGPDPFPRTRGDTRSSGHQRRWPRSGAGVQASSPNTISGCEPHGSTPGINSRRAGLMPAPYQNPASPENGTMAAAEGPAALG
jgi:hypothetical protein